MGKSKITINKLKKIRASRKALVKKLDNLVSLIVRLRDGRCIQCHSKESLTCGHLFSRTAYSTRWDLGNCYGQCLAHNLRHEYDPYAMTLAVTNLKGKEYVDDLYRRWHTPVILKDFQLEEMVKQYEVILKDLQKHE